MQLRTLLAPIALLALAAPSLAQCWEQHLEVGVVDTSLAGGLAVGPGRIAIGQPHRNPYGTPQFQDVVRVFEGSPGSFVEVATLTSTLTTSFSSGSFGATLDMDGDWLAVGDAGGFDAATGARGAVHLYQRTGAGWVLDSVLFQPSAGVLFPSGGFGKSLDLDGDLLAVGAPYASTVNTQGAIEDGLAYIFERGPAGWTLLQTIAPRTALLFGGFGRSIALDRDPLGALTLAVGRTGDPVPGGSTFNGGGAGALHLFERVGAAPFAATHVLQAAAPIEAAALGWSVALRGDLLVTGAIGEVVGGEYAAGRAHVFERDALGAWSETATLEVAPLRPYMRFGDDVQLDQGDLLITSESVASAWRYREVNGVWTAVHNYVTEAGVGWPIPMQVRVRAVGGLVALTDPEGVTVFDAQPAATARIGCEAVPIPSSSPSHPGVPVYLDVKDELRLSRPSLALQVYGGSSVGNGVLFYGFTPASVPLGTGVRCVGGPLARAAFGVAVPGALTTHLTLDLRAFPVSAGALAITPGVDVHFQYWFRAPAGTSHLTNSLVLSFCP